MNDKKYLFEKDSVPHALFVMAIPTIISQLIILIYNMADTWFIGQTNNPYMVAACSLVLPAFMLTIVITNVFGTGGGTLIARLIGSGRQEEASRVSAVCLWMAFTAAVIYSLICLALMDPFLRLLGASDNTIAYARQYMLFVIVIGAAPAILSNTMSSMLRSIGLASQASFGLSMGGLLNTALDPLFMFVILKNGQQVMGAALATMISNMASFIYFAVIYRKAVQNTLLRVTLKNGLPEKSSLFQIFAVGLPAAAGTLLFDLCNIVINRLSAGHGDIELAAVGIVLKAERLPLNIGIGICLGMVPLIAYNYSSRNRKRMDDVFLFGRAAGLGIAVFCVLLYYLFAPVIMKSFIRDADTVSYGTRFLRARCFATPLMFLCFSMIHFTQSIGRGLESFLLAVIRQIVFNIPLLFLLNHLFGMTGIVWTQVIADTFTVIVSYLIYFRIRRQEGFPPSI